MKKLFLCFILILLVTPNCMTNKKNDDFSVGDIYKEQAKISGALELKDKLPKESQKSMDRIGISGESWEEFSKLTPESILKEIVSIGKEKSCAPLASLTPVLAIILLTALIENFKASFGENHIGKIMSSVSALCICICIINPIVKSISSIASVIKISAGFMLCYIPVMTGIMAASGQPASSVPYHIMMMSAGQVITQISSHLLIPVMNSVLGISVISSLSPRFNLSGICDMFHKIVKWLLGLLTSIFVGILTIQNIVASPADNLGAKTMKFALNSFVPIVGGALSDAFNTVQGCVKLLKSGVGAFGIIAGTIVFMPVLIECVVWILFLNICAEVGNVFELKQVSGLLKSSEKVMSTMLAVILSCMMVLIVSTVLILIIGGG